MRVAVLRQRARLGMVILVARILVFALFARGAKLTSILDKKLGQSKYNIIS